MQFIRSASFGDLFTVTFLVAAMSQVILAGLGALAAVLSPSLFSMNGVKAVSAGPALGTLLFMTVAFLFINAGMSAMGAGCWMALRRFLPAEQVKT